MKLDYDSFILLNTTDHVNEEKEFPIHLLNQLKTKFLKFFASSDNNKFNNNNNELFVFAAFFRSCEQRTLLIFC